MCRKALSHTTKKDSIYEIKIKKPLKDHRMQWESIFIMIVLL